MEFTELIEFIEQLLDQYGYLVLLIGLPLDAIALPIPPGNTTLTLAGYLSFTGTFTWYVALLAAYVGAVVGITITYWIGFRVGKPMIDRYGKWLGLKQTTLQRTRELYEKYGNQLLLFSFFTPGIRQFIGYFIGIIRVPFQIFALYAYIGAAIWVSLFFVVGYVFGDQWHRALLLLEKYLKYLLICIIIFGLLVFFWKRYLRIQANKLDKEVD